MVIVRGQFYWEVDVCNSTLYRIGEEVHPNPPGHDLLVVAEQVQIPALIIILLASGMLINS